MSRMPEEYDSNFIQFVELFNQGQYEESHRVLIESWIRNRSNDFYRGLIQMAGALEHWETDSLFWAEDMFASAYNLLAKYAPRYQGLDVDALLNTLQEYNAAAKRAREQAQSKHAVALPPIVLKWSSD